MTEYQVPRFFLTLLRIEVTNLYNNLINSYKTYKNVDHPRSVTQQDEIQDKDDYVILITLDSETFIESI